MRKYIPVTNIDDKTVYLNPARIVMVRPQANDPNRSAVVMLTTGYELQL